MELNPQAITPPVNPENELFVLWANSLGQERLDAEKKLMAPLRRHAAKVCWMVLHTHQPHLVEEIVQDTILELPTFRRESAFSTWFHSRATNRCRLELRRLIQRKEVPIEDSLSQQITNADVGRTLLAKEIVAGLSEEDRKFVSWKVFQGLTNNEIAKERGCSVQAVQQKWSRLRRKLKEQYDGNS